MTHPTLGHYPDPSRRPAWQSPYLLLTLCALFWAGNSVVGRALHDSVPPVTLAFWRWCIALL
ncbi:MAG TPA: EamA family transporter, partial [Burkholderiales bacterium]|nr:EamA family transporter [Burkholderiales bacterium]